jgi:hypothetical protein
VNLPPRPRTCPAAGRSRPHPAQDTGTPSRPSWAVLGRPRHATHPHPSHGTAAPARPTLAGLGRTRRPTPPHPARGTGAPARPTRARLGHPERATHTHPAHGQASDPALARLRTARAHRGGGGGRGGAGTPASSIWVRLPRQAPRGLPDLGGRLGEFMPLFCPKTAYAPRAVHFAIIPSKTRLFRVFSGTLPTLQNTPFPASQASYVGSIPIARSTQNPLFYRGFLHFRDGRPPAYPPLFARRGKVRGIAPLPPSPISPIFEPQPTTRGASPILPPAREREACRGR